jgi:hypothetical protein
MEEKFRDVTEDTNFMETFTFEGSIKWKLLGK